MTDEPIDWNQRYTEKATPWDSGRPSRELRRILHEYDVGPSRVLELGCGTGTNALFLRQEGFDVTAVDISSVAIEEARRRARDAGLEIELAVGDVCDLSDVGPPFPFVFDRGVYHTVRTENLSGFLKTLSRVTQPQGLYLTLTGNANEHQAEGGPPRVSNETICHELSPLFELVQLREFRFDARETDDAPLRPLAWSALLRRKS